jgi:hypothetical protein
MSDLERALALVVEHEDKADFFGPVAADVVDAAEAALGIRCMPTGGNSASVGLRRVRAVHA